MENKSCENCPFYRELEKRVDKLEASMEGVQKDISDIRVNQAETKQQITTIFVTLKRIEESVEKIFKKLEDRDNEISTRLNKLELKPADTFDKLKVALITGLGTGLIGLFLGYLFTK